MSDRINFNPDDLKDPNAPQSPEEMQKMDPASAYKDFKGLVKPITDVVGDVYNKIRAPRQQAIDIVSKQLDLNKEGDPEFRKMASTALDVGLPDVSDAVPFGAIAGMVGKGARDAALLNKVGGETRTAAVALERAEPSALGRLAVTDDAAKIKPYKPVEVRKTLQELKEEAENQKLLEAGLARRK